MSDDQAGVVTLKVRVTPEFREKIVKTAKENNRSMNQEIVHRLESSFEATDKSFKLSEEHSLNKALLPVFQNSNAKRMPVINDQNERRRLAHIAAMAVMQALENDQKED